MKAFRKRIVLIVLAVLAAASVALAFRPEPVPVEVGKVRRGPLRVTVDEEGETRIHHRYVLSAPVPGRLQRIELHEGDPVEEGSVVARLDPAPLDARAREAAEARLQAARATQREAEAQVHGGRVALEDARRTLSRTERLARDQVVAADELDRARTAEGLRAEELEAAELHARAAAFEVGNARAALLEGGSGPGAEVPLRSPVAGRVLRVCEACEKVVPAGTSLLEVGDLGTLEVVVDVLSSDAVALRPGSLMLLTAGGGNREEIRARVRVVEPSGFTKVSPLGVEEQRVNVIGDFIDPPGRLGDRYRVDASIVLWEGGDVLKVPAGALFRQGDGWAVFTVEDGKVRTKTVQVGHRNPMEAEVLAGLSPGETVVVHPGDRVREGVRVEVR